ncbi:MAG: tRNA pseudouridine(38-40) synthase TruA, partial [Prolixibacteraceae bacterium]|nr:tRNA pseudouridine(38-40) synthase TruA [Prolixibacteraceae bacterium]
LPNDIAVRAIYPVNGDAHARFSATSRTYSYYISRMKNPFTTETSWHYLWPIDVSEMNKAAALLTKYEDFTSFSKLHSDAKTNNCKIVSAIWKEENERLIFTITADRFLRNMVRAIVGTLVDVGRGKISINNLASVVEKRDRCAAGTSAPAQGLFLTAVEYPEWVKADV